MSRPNVLVVLSSHSAGWYLPEFAHPYQVLSPYCNLTIASPLGGATTLDPVSVELFKNDAYCAESAATQQKLWMETEKLESFTGRSGEFDAIFYVGGFGPMFDLVDNQVSIQLVEEFHNKNLVVSAVCHGSAALINAKLPNGTRLIAGDKVTGFSNEEEIAINKQKDMPFHLEDALNEVTGGHYVKAEQPWGECVSVVKEKKLITGQNPASSKAIGVAVLKMLKGEN